MSLLNEDPYLRGSGETLKSLRKQSEGHRDWRDSLNWIARNDVYSDPDRIDWTKRAIDSDGQVRVSWFDSLIGRSQPELQAAYESWRQGEVKGSAAAEDYRQTFGKGPEIRPGVGTTDILSITRKEKDRRSSVDKLLPTLASMKNGAEVIASLGDAPTKEEVLTKISELSTKNTGEAEDRQDGIRQEGYTEAAKIRNHTIQEGNNQRAHEASENSKLQAWKTQQENSRLAHTASENNKTRRFQAETAKYDANTKLQISRMESADRRADRAAAREDRLASQRQQSIAALMKGLTQLGAGFAI